MPCHFTWRILTLFICSLTCLTLSAQPPQIFKVFFPTGVYKLPADAQRSIDSLFYMNLVQTARQIQVTGFADDPGSSPANKLLSERRAQAVKDYLLASGIKPAIITEMTGRGDSLATVKDGSNAADRRVDVALIFMLPPQTKLAAQIKHVKKGDAIALDDLLFHGGSSQVLPSSKPVLDTLLAVMLANPGLRICLEGHICCMAGTGDAYDVVTNRENLSESRAYTVYNYLVKGGVSKYRLCARGFGHSRPKVYPEINEEAAARNRRVEVRVVATE